MTAHTDAIERARREAADAAVQHLMACDEELMGEVEDDTQVSIGPFGGCTDCQVRETLDVSWPIILRHAAELLGQHAGQEQAAGILAAEAQLATPTPGGGAPWA